MALEQDVMAQMKTAMLTKNEAALRALRAIKSAILLAKTADGKKDDLTSDDEMKLLQKLKNKYGSWEVAFGVYNTGRPMVNQYAMDVYRFEPNW